MFPVLLEHLVPPYEAQSHIAERRAGEFRVIGSDPAPVHMMQWLDNKQDERFNRFASVWKADYFMAAQWAEKYAVHYDGFKVGAGLLAIRYDLPIGHPKRYKSFYGFNTKLKKGICPHKKCAERRAREQATNEGYHEIVGIVVVGLPRDASKEVEELVTPTLHPCLQCQEEMRHDPMMRPDTLILTAKFEQYPDPIEFDCHTFSQILRLHGQPDIIR